MATIIFKGERRFCHEVIQEGPDEGVRIANTYGLRADGAGVSAGLAELRDGGE